MADVVRNVSRYVSVGIHLSHEQRNHNLCHTVHPDFVVLTWLQHFNLSSVRAKLDRSQVAAVMD